MIFEILGRKAIKVDGDVQIDYRTGKTVIYVSETTEYLIVNPDEIVAITIGKKIKTK